MKNKKEFKTINDMAEFLKSQQGIIPPTNSNFSDPEGFLDQVNDTANKAKKENRLIALIFYMEARKPDSLNQIDIALVSQFFDVETFEVLTPKDKNEEKKLRIQAGLATPVQVAQYRVENET